jgi:predicted pyridoxine 5'-phosphate oxidase superfamily flavin-nucleotide-binding protein
LVNDRLGPAETAFIAARDGFYIASVSETGWPYIQFRGGPAGFLRIIDERTLGFADFRGNRQYSPRETLAAMPASRYS